MIIRLIQNQIEKLLEGLIRNATFVSANHEEAFIIFTQGLISLMILGFFYIIFLILLKYSIFSRLIFNSSRA